ncbi:PepSY domain-containing protein [Ruoffia tabacinasalis]|uniref:PepSY domain-containing protein n=1 Tax=Ruoffia tabacinasalis TaxID=87458 RepID=UPI0030CA8134
MKKSLKSFALLGISGLMLTAVAPHVTAQDDSQEASTSEESVSSEESTESTDEAQTEESDLQVALNDAVALFQEEYPNAEIEELEVELRNEEYRITIHGFEDNIEYEVDFSVAPVEITDRDEDNEDDNDNDGEALVLEDLITIDEASEIALEEASEGTITDWDLDSDDGRVRWEIEIDGVENPDQDDDDNKLHIEIDAETGDILNVEFDD